MTRRSFLIRLTPVFSTVAPLACAADNTTPKAAPPLIVEASEDVTEHFPGAPQLQSFAWAQWQGKWVFIAGRIGGYHGVGQGDVDFPRARANAHIWVVDPEVKPNAKSYSFAVANLPASMTLVKDQWMSSNPAYWQDGDTLYLLGGYGQNSAGDLVTYPVLSCVNLPALIQGVTQGKDTFSSSIAWGESPAVQSSGGDLIRLDDGNFYLAGGHVFMGTYRAFEAQNEKNTAKVYQNYLSEIRRLRVTRAKGRLNIELLEKFTHPEFARRDGNLAPLILSDGKLGAAMYGGVFTKDQMNFEHPVYFGAAQAPTVDAYVQKMSSYACANIALYDPDTRKMYTTFLGGISRYTWNYTKQTFEAAPVVGSRNTGTTYYDGFPWIDSITTLIRSSDGATVEVVQPDNRLAGYLGANGAFIPSPELKLLRADASILDFRQFRGRRVFAGHLYGGIRAFPKQFPYNDDAPSYSAGNVPTKASDMVVKVYITVPDSN